VIHVIPGKIRLAGEFDFQILSFINRKLGWRKVFKDDSILQFTINIWIETRGLQYY